jgi:hypothetical protein
MSDEFDAGRAEYERQQGQISPGSLDFYRDRLNDPQFAAQWPEQHAALKASVDRALAGSGQSLDRPSDPRSTPQQVHDARFGISFEDGKPALPCNLQAAIDNDGGENDPHLVAAAINSIGRSYTDDVKAATRLLEQAGVTISAATLSAHTLSQLAIFAAHAARHSQGRPQ